VRRVEALLGAPPARNAVAGPLLFLGDALVTGSLAAVALQLDHAVAALPPVW
jgi:uncharacterized membrane protein YgdD (TMEM256/DUF423 family)